MSREVTIGLKGNRQEGDGSWKNQARCRGLDQDMFFPFDADGGELAKQVCRQCVVIVECGDYALRNREKHGVWGGMNESDRQLEIRLRNGATL